MCDIIKKWSNYTQKCIALKYNALIFEFVYIIKYDTYLLAKKWFSGNKYSIICQNTINTIDVNKDYRMKL